MQITFTGRKVLITGSTAGIGFATAQAFVAAGATVVINGRSPARVDARSPDWAARRHRCPASQAICRRRKAARNWSPRIPT